MRSNFKENRVENEALGGTGQRGGFGGIVVLSITKSAFYENAKRFRISGWDLNCFETQTGSLGDANDLKNRSGGPLIGCAQGNDCFGSNHTLMKTYRILAILWLIANSVAALTAVRTLMFPAPKVSGLVLTLFYIFLGSLLLLDLVGIAASIFLICGATWARWFLGLGAVLYVCACIAQVVELRSLSMSTGAYGIFAFVSAVLLLMPKRYIAA
ncbi:MAG TPA: hypothetical protein VN873_12490 [Candidatus Angelobacter sp.]|nr:hypothetical protein [Candidatus Angelobacter sp.]